MVHIARLSHSDARGATALVTLCGENLVVMISQLHAVFTPGADMVLEGDRAADALRGAD